ncbi:ABC transporter permease [Rugosibacter aromaticivorans]|uniref:ABC transporter permease n=2 Tax=Bacteria TaxID=2 RepID=A0A0C5J932_9PROT|nr:FtsX-like permease family protein [Rugosibacter aromaticivorans]AJP48243.1 ABC transporter permease [Rugosibacter aromaticivorans]TBR14477.1 MAG: FtsX-like permease family protein [Rugosibacter sp.]
MRNFNLAWRMLRRDWRAGELTVVGMAIVLAVAALTSVGFLTDRVEQALKLEAHQLLGGDLLLTADHPWVADYRREAAARGLRIAESTTFPSMVQINGTAQLAEIKAVSENYPLRGALRIAPVLNVKDATTQHVPRPGEAWPDERLATALNLAPGMALALGNTDVKIDAILTLEPDRGTNLFAIAPRLMINLADLPVTGLIQNGSRVSYRLHLAGEPAAVAGFGSWAEARLGRGEKLESLDNARPEIRNITERAQRFLRLAALLAVILAAVAVALAAERYLRRHLDSCAVMRCLGASGAQLLLIHGGEFLLFGLLATLVGCGLGYATQAVLQQLLGGLLVTALPAPSWLPWLHGLLVGLILVGGFALPPLLRLRRASTLRVLRRELATEPASIMAYLLGSVLLAALMLWMADGLRLGLIVLAGFLAALIVFTLMLRGWVALLGLVRPAGSGYGWRHGLVNLRRRLNATLVQAVALALGLTALLLFTVARGDLLASWQKRLPADAPNRFVINIQPDQRLAIADFFTAHGLPPPALAPMVRGRLVAVNGAAINPTSYPDEQAQRLVDREFNLSWSADLPAGNRVTSGRWHGNIQRAEFSVEQGIAKTLHLKLGDRLVYDIAGQRVEASITSLRTLDWDSMRVNFFVIAPPGLLDAASASYITSFYLPAARGALIPDLVKAFPNLTVIDVASLVRQLNGTLDQVVHAVELVFGFAVLAGLAVLSAALQASSDERQHELAVLRALGARRRQLARALLAEFLMLGAMAGLLGGIAASLIGWGLARFVFQLDYLPQPHLWFIGLFAGSAMVAAVGWMSSVKLLRQPAMVALRG